MCIYADAYVYVPYWYVKHASEHVSPGEFGIVYKGHLLDSTTKKGNTFAVNTVAVKTLKGENLCICTHVLYQLRMYLIHVV